ncbi:MAG TPA: PilZ domain-containing protein [Polyangiaceae bacterium]|jgi:hypothetical protein|nr:PilZ domain-containing protein [Polyangiaceae bacterium]
MLKAEDKIFFRLPKEDRAKKRVLRPATVCAYENPTLTLRLEEPCVGIEPGEEATIHFEARRKFMQQLARVLHKESEQPLMLVIQLLAEPISSESRQCYRVSCLGENIRATVDSEAGCEVVDLSATGLAFYSRRDWALGSQVHITLSHAGKIYEGQATIMSSRRMTPKTIRHGVLCTEREGGTLARSLAAINLAIQSEQQRRLAGQSR